MTSELHRGTAWSAGMIQSSALGSGESFSKVHCIFQSSVLHMRGLQRLPTSAAAAHATEAVAISHLKFRTVSGGRPAPVLVAAAHAEQATALQDVLKAEVVPHPSCSNHMLWNCSAASEAHCIAWSTAASGALLSPWLLPKLSVSCLTRVLTPA